MLKELKKHNAIVQERIMKSFGYADTEDFIQKGEDEIELIQKGEIDYDWEFEKAVYADTAQNRRLGRVGKQYNRKKSETEKINLKIGRTVNYSLDTNEPYIITKINSNGTVNLKGKRSGFQVLGVPNNRLKPKEGFMKK